MDCPHKNVDMRGSKNLGTAFEHRFLRTLSPSATWHVTTISNLQRFSCPIHFCLVGQRPYYTTHPPQPSSGNFVHVYYSPSCFSQSLNYHCCWTLIFFQATTKLTRNCTASPHPDQKSSKEDTKARKIKFISSQ